MQMRWVWAALFGVIAMAPFLSHCLAADGNGAVLAPGVEVSVEAGGTANVELRALFTARPGIFGGGGARESEFRLVVPPRFGTIEELRQLPLSGDRDSATARYRHNAEAGGFFDEAQFDVRDLGDGTVFSRVAVKINILRAVLSVEPAGRLWLGECVVGDDVEGVVTFENKGGAPLSFRVAAWRPFYVEDGGRDLFLSPGARVPVRFRFRPEEAGLFETPLILRPEHIRGYTIEAKAVEALVPATNHLDFGTLYVGAEGRSQLRLKNRAREARDIEAQLSGPFSAQPPRARIPALGDIEISVVCRPSATGQALGWLVIQEGRSVIRCQLTANALLGPRLFVESGQSANMGVVSGLAAVASHRILVTNRGDVAWQGSVQGHAFFKPDLQSLRLEPSQSAAVSVRYTPTAFGAHTGSVAFLGQTTASVTLAAASVAPSAAEPKQSPDRYAMLPLPEPVLETNKEPTPSAGRVPVVEPILATLPGEDLDALPVFEPPNLRASVIGDRSIAVEWDPSADLPLERLDLFERRFVPRRGQRAVVTWLRRPEVPRLSADGRTASVVVEKLQAGGQFEFAIAQTDEKSRPLKRTPVIEVETAMKRERRIPWKTIIIAACGTLILLHFFGASIAAWFSKR